MAKYTIGIDFGTLSGRAVLVDIKNGNELFSSVYTYPHSVMDRKLPSGRELPPEYALQHPRDYIEVITNTVPELLKGSKVDAGDIIGIGIDFTACTVLPVMKEGTPLCMVEGFEEEPHAYVKLWKHHAAQKYADIINSRAEERKESWLRNYGGKISSEWYFPKLMEIYCEAKEIYDSFDLFVEAADWVVWQLTGKLSRNYCTAGYKAIWSKEDGFPGVDYLESLAPGFSSSLEKLEGELMPLGGRAGMLSREMADRLGLSAETAVAVANVDAHVTMPALGIAEAGKMLAIMGTSTCHILMGKEKKTVPGMCGVVEEGVMPGFYGYEAGQSCVGDHFDWVVKNCVPPEYYDEAKKLDMGIHEYLRSTVEKQRPGESGLIALDWWNGNRSVLVDVDLSGLILGMTLRTRPEEIYRALIEATAFGTRKIIETFEENGVPVKEFYASGGISQKDPMTMQIYADVIRRPVKIAGSTHGPALGSAIFGAVAAGKEKGGYSNIFEAAKAMGKVKDVVYIPKEENSRIYDKLYNEYSALHDFFGRGGNDVMKRLKKIRDEGERK